MPHRKYSDLMLGRARKMRSEPTKAESKLWQSLRAQKTGHKFRRQHTILGRYIVDFVCLELSLIIEIDGGQHLNNPQDDVRTTHLETEGFKVIRFWNNEINDNLDGCLAIIHHEIYCILNSKGR